MSYLGGINVLNGTISSDHLPISASFVSIMPFDMMISLMVTSRTSGLLYVTVIGPERR